METNMGRKDEPGELEEYGIFRCIWYLRMNVARQDKSGMNPVWASASKRYRDAARDAPPAKAWDRAALGQPLAGQPSVLNTDSIRRIPFQRVPLLSVFRGHGSRSESSFPDQFVLPLGENHEP